MVTLARRAERVPFAPVVAALFGTAAAVLVAAVPQRMFEASVVASGLPTVLAAAAPPLGLVARVLAIALAFVVVAAVLWAALTPLAHAIEGKARARTPWRDAGYDADTDRMRDFAVPQRRPIFAPDELGAPLMSDAAIAARTPTEVVADDRESVADFLPVKSETFESVVRPPRSADNSIAALIRRLEDGLARRADDDRGPDGSGGGIAAAAYRPTEAGGIVAPPARPIDDGSMPQSLWTQRAMARG